MIRLLSSISVMAIVLAAGCVNQDARVKELTEENTRLQLEIARLNAAPSGEAPQELRTIQSFTVGLAASERDFDSAAFEALFTESLETASQSPDVKVVLETDERQINKIRGMLMQQYLAAQEVPIQITNLSFKVQNAEHEFKLGEQVVPRAGLDVSQPSPDSSVIAKHAGPIPAVMHRDSQGRYSVTYEELGGGSGSIRIQANDREVLNTEQTPHAERQGDISFNWSLNLDQIQVYQVKGFRGDVGLFLSRMRYSGIQSSIGQYQTLRDLVFLFGYGSYVTSLVNQIRTPEHIGSVEVLPVDDEVLGKLDGRLTEPEINELVGPAARWQTCKFVDFSNTEKIWERPPAVGFPFISRQASDDKNQVFYLKYTSEGAFFLGDFER